MFLTKLYKHFSREWYRILQDILAMIPGEIGMKIRGYFYKIYLGSVGAKILIHMFCWLTHPQNIYIGSHSGCNRFSYLDGAGGIRIGDNVIIGIGVKIISSKHNINTTYIPICEQGWSTKPIVIKDDVWIGSNAVILPGVQIEKGAVVGAGAVVTKNIDQYVIVGGIPAREIGRRNGNKLVYHNENCPSL